MSKHKGMIRSTSKNNIVDRLKQWDEAVGAETPTDYMRGKLDAYKEVNKDLELGIKDTDWKASSQRGEAA